MDFNLTMFLIAVGGSLVIAAIAIWGCRAPVRGSVPDNPHKYVGQGWTGANCHVIGK